MVAGAVLGRRNQVARRATTHHGRVPALWAHHDDEGAWAVASVC